MLRYKRTITSAWFLSLLLLVLGAAVTEYLVAVEANSKQMSERLDAVAFGNNLHAKVERELNALLFISTGISSYINAYQTDLNPDRLRAILANLYHNSRNVRNLGVAVGYRMTYVYPVKGNEKVVGLDYHDVPAQLAKVQQAIDTRHGVLDGPLTLVQGGKAIIYRFPIFVDDRYWGVISTVINVPTFFASAFADVSDKHYQFAIRKLDNPRQPGEVFYGDAALFQDAGSVLLTQQVPNGTWQWAIKNMQPLPSLAANTIRIFGWLLSAVLALVLFRFVKERHRLKHDALSDHLTGLANRRLLIDRLEQALRLLGRSTDQTCSLFFFDLNGFKQINDTYGHVAGDFVLKEVAHRVADQVRNVDTVSRLGGDEYAIVMSHHTDSKLPNSLEHRLRSTIYRPIHFDGQELRVSCAIGVATYSNDGVTAHQLLKIADARMYEDKKRLKAAA